MKIVEYIESKDHYLILNEDESGESLKAFEDSQDQDASEYMNDVTELIFSLRTRQYGYTCLCQWSAKSPNVYLEVVFKSMTLSLYTSSIYPYNSTIP